MSKKKGTFRDKIDSILADGGAPADDQEQSIAPLRARVDAILAGAESTPVVPPGDDALARLLSPTTETKLDEIDLALIKGAGRRPTGKRFEDLKSSIADNGVLQPVLLRPVDGGYEVVDGAKRIAAARSLKLAAVPAVVRALTDAEARVTSMADREEVAAVDVVPLPIPVPLPEPGPSPHRVGSARPKTAARKAAATRVPARKAPARAASRRSPLAAQPVVAGPIFGADLPDAVEAGQSPGNEQPRAAAASALHPTRDDRDQFRVAAASASDAPATPPHGQAMLQWYLFLVVVGFASFAFFSFFQYSDGATGIQGSVLGGVILAVILFLMVWRRS